MWSKMDAILAIKCLQKRTTDIREEDRISDYNVVCRSNFPDFP